MNMLDSLRSVSPDCEIVSTRIFDADRSLVFKAWIDPKHLQAWWGPAGFTNTFLEFDLQPGGVWRFVMHGPNGGNYQNHCKFLYIDPPERIVWKRISQPLFHVWVTFDDLDAQTRVVFRMIFDSADLCRKVAKVAGSANEENFDRLEAELAKMKV